MLPEYTPKDIARFWSKVDTSGECWLWTAYRGVQGYGSISIGRKGIRAHRLAWEVTHGPIPAGLHVCHRCDNPACVRTDHLFLGTARENRADCDSKGRSARGATHGSKTHPERVPRGERNGARKHRASMPRGSRHHNAKLDEAKVQAIRLRYAQGGVTIVALAHEYGVSKSTIGYVVTGTYWQHLGDPLP